MNLLIIQKKTAMQISIVLLFFEIFFFTNGYNLSPHFNVKLKGNYRKTSFFGLTVNLGNQRYFTSLL